MRGRWVQSRTPWGWLGSYGFVGFTRARPGGSWVHLGWFGSLARALVVIGFITGRLVHLRAPWFWFGSSGVVQFTHARLGVREIHAGPLACALGVVGFMRVHSRAPCGLLGLSRVFGFIHLCHRVVGFINVLWVQSHAPWGSLGSLAHAQWIVGFIGVVWFTRALPGGHWIHLG